MTDKLSLYNLALTHLRERRLASLNEQCEPRRVLDGLFPQVQQECLEEAQWNFMIRAVRIDASETVTPTFGWTYAFKIPLDWIRTVTISLSEAVTPPLLDYAEETGYWFADSTPLFVRYVSSDPQYGTDLGAWPANFTAYVAFKLAEYTCGRISGTEKLLEGPHGIVARCRRAKIKAKSNDAMNQPPGRLPEGTWVQARRGSTGRGSRGIGYDD